MDSNFKKYMIGAVVVLAFFAYLVLSGSNDSSQSSPVMTETTAQPAVASGTTAGVVSSAGSVAKTPAGTPPTTGGGTSAGSTTGSANATATASTGQYKNGTYTGLVADAFYGELQVAAVVQGGQLTDVQFLQSPQDGGHTKKISETALPVLKQEAISAQSAQVSIVSGATQTSEAFQQSLAGALAQAK